MTFKYYIIYSLLRGEEFLKNNYVIILMIMLFCFGFLNTIYTPITSAQQGYTLSIEETSFEIYRIQQLTRTQTSVYYNISIVLRNSGLEDSVDITLEIIDNEEFSLKKNATIPAESQHEFSWRGEDFFLIQNGDHYINIEYYPTNTQISKNTQNSGSELLYLYKRSDDTSTPGFQAVLVVGVLVLFFLTKRLKK